MCDRSSIRSVPVELQRPIVIGRLMYRRRSSQEMKLTKLDYSLQPGSKRLFYAVYAFRVCCMSHRRLLPSCIFFGLMFCSVAAKSASGPTNNMPQALQPSTINAVELVRQAMSNYEARKSGSADYVYLEHWSTRWSRGYASSDLYEVIPIAGDLYRRHLLHNDQLLPEQDEKKEKEKLELALRQRLDQSVEINPTPDLVGRQGSPQPSQTGAPTDPELAEIQSETVAARKTWDDTLKRLGRDAPIYSGGEWFKRLMQDLRLPLEHLPGAFDVRLKGTEILDGREAYVVVATPKLVPDDSGHRNNDDEDEQNFEMMLWIDRADTQLVKVEGKAIREGVLSSKPDYAVMDTQNYTSEAVAKAKASMYKSSLRYSRGTTLTEEWTKIDNAVWLPKRLYIKGKEIWEHTVVFETGQTTQSSPAIPVTHEITYLRYQKFHVNTRILPAKPE